MIEVEVHSSLRAFLKAQDHIDWPHHLTMARLIARALRLGRSALIQTSSSVGRYCFSYLMPALLGDWSVVLVAPESVQQSLLQQEIPLLQDWLQTKKKVRIDDRWREEDGLLITTPQAWLSDRLNQHGRFPPHILTIIDCAEDLEAWVSKELTITLEMGNWYELIDTAPQYTQLIQNVRLQLTQSIFAHPSNPYECYLLDKIERETLHNLFTTLAQENLLTPKLKQLWQQWQQAEPIIWTTRDRLKGKFTIYTSPPEVATALKPIWQQQPVILIGSYLDRESSAPIYRQQLGLGELLCLQFSPHRRDEYIQLYLSDRLPMPNTPDFQKNLLDRVLMLTNLSRNVPKPVVILVNDVPLKAQVGSALAAEFGSKVQVEKTNLAEDGILVCGWEFWHHFSLKAYAIGSSSPQGFPKPQLLIMATLPLPSLENPLVASRVAYYKHQRQDWFRLYLLPTALKAIQQAIIPLRESQGIVALLDNRVNYRSYGKTILTALEPCARINYIDPTWFGLNLS